MYTCDAVSILEGTLSTVTEAGRFLVGMGGADRSSSTKACTGRSAAMRSWPGNTKGVPRTASAVDTLAASFGTALRPNNTQGRCSGHLLLASRARKVSFSCR
jgi:hypothetical protein